MSHLTGRPCSVCTHPDRHKVDRRLVAGEAFGAISQAFEIGEASLRRHYAAHLPRSSMAKAAADRAEDENGRNDDLVRQAQQLRGKVINLLLQAERSGDLRTAISGCREAGRLLELQSRLLGAIKPDTNTVNVTFNTQFVVVQQTILVALEKHPAARADVIAALEQLS